MSKKYTKEKFIIESQKVHGNKYDYSKIEYVNNRTKICIICPEHGEFWQTPSKHLYGQGCPLCSKTKKGSNKTFIKLAREIHEDKYDYSKVKYINNRTKVCIICPEHGEFFQDPHNHLKGKGCPLCGETKNKPKKYTTETFIDAANKIHNELYDYSKCNYVNMNTKVCIICPKHGEFWQTPYQHLNGAKCPNCASLKNGFEKRLTTETFIEKAKQIHGNKYDYSKTKYITSKRKVCIICNQHGEFWQTPDKHLQGCGCQKCVHHVSKGESEIFNYIASKLGKENVIQSERNLIFPKEIDIFIPSLKIGIEYNGLFWHSNIDKNNHLIKLNFCKEKGIKLIQIFEDEYVNNKEIVLSKIRHLLGIDENLPKIMGRKCIIHEISHSEAKQFLDKNHIQSFIASTAYIGAFYENVLVAVMSFRQEKTGSNNWELTRFTSDNNYICQGIGGKLFKYFTKNYNPSYIKSFADRRWTINENENIYTKLGFYFDGYTEPDYKYFNPSDGIKRQHKFGFRKKILNKKYGLPLSMTESEMTEKLGYKKIYDCGLIRYVWKK